MWSTDWRCHWHAVLDKLASKGTQRQYWSLQVHRINRPQWNYIRPTWLTLHDRISSDTSALLFNLWHCWLSVRKSIWPVKKWVMRCWCAYLSGARCKWFAYGLADGTATPSSLASLKSRMVLTFLLPAYPGCSGKEIIKQLFAVLFMTH